MSRQFPDAAVDTVGYATAFDEKTGRGNFRVVVSATPDAGAPIELRIRTDYDLKNQLACCHLTQKIAGEWKLIGHRNYDDLPKHPQESVAKYLLQKETEELVQNYAGALSKGQPTPVFRAGEDPLREQLAAPYYLEKSRLVISDIGLRQAVERTEVLFQTKLAPGLAIHQAAAQYGQTISDVAHTLGLKAALSQKRPPLENRIEIAIKALHRQNAGAVIDGYGTQEAPRIPTLLRLEAEEAQRTESPLAGAAEELLATLGAARELARENKEKGLNNLLPFEQ